MTINKYFKLKKKEKGKYDIEIFLIFQFEEFVTFLGSSDIYVFF